MSQFLGYFYPSNANNSHLIATEDGSQNFVTICSTELSNATLWLVVDEMNVVVVGGNSQLSFPSGGLHLGVVGPFLKVTILALKNLVSIIMRTSSRPDHYTAGLLCK